MKGEVLLPGQDVGVNLETRRGNQIPTSRRLPRHRSSMEAAKELWDTSFANIEVRSLDATYNCVGMVFAFRRAWVEPTHVSQMLQDDEYREVVRNEAVPGDLVAYYQDSNRAELAHIGIIVAKEKRIELGDWGIRVLSQWGADGEYLHDETDVPQCFGNIRAYWSERKC